MIGDLEGGWVVRQLLQLPVHLGGSPGSSGSGGSTTSSSSGSSPGGDLVVVAQVSEDWQVDEHGKGLDDGGHGVDRKDRRRSAWVLFGGEA